jgi:hypothetical protein
MLLLSIKKARNQAQLPHTLNLDDYVGQCLHLFSVPAPTPTTSVRGAQAIFRAKTFLVLYPNSSTIVTRQTYPPMKMEQADGTETLAIKL